MEITLKLFYSLCMLNFLVACTYSIVAPIYPLRAQQLNISTFLIGVVFSVESFSSIISSLVLGKLMSFWGKRKVIKISMFVVILGITLFGFEYYITQTQVFFIGSIFSRALQGMGSSSIYVIIYSLIPVLFDENESQDKLGQCEAIGSLSWIIGPLIGSLLFLIGGYKLPFFALAGFLLVIAIFLIPKLPFDQINNSELLIKTKKTLQYKKFFFHKKLIFILFLMYFLGCSFSYIEPTLALHLYNQFGISSKASGLFFGIGALSYGIPVLSISYIRKYVDRRVLIILGTFMEGICFFFLGPEPMIFNSRIIFVILGLILFGFGIALASITTLPYMISIGQTIYPDPSDKDLVSDMCSGIFNSVFIAGTLTGPNLSGFLNQVYGYHKSSSLFGLALLIYLIIYIFGCEHDVVFRPFKQMVKQPNNEINEGLLQIIHLDQQHSHHHHLNQSFHSNQQQNHSEKLSLNDQIQLSNHNVVVKASFEISEKN